MGSFPPGSQAPDEHLHDPSALGRGQAGVMKLTGRGRRAARALDQGSALVGCDRESQGAWAGCEGEGGRRARADGASVRAGRQTDPPAGRRRSVGRAQTDRHAPDAARDARANRARLFARIDNRAGAVLSLVEPLTDAGACDETSGFSFRRFSPPSLRSGFLIIVPSERTFRYQASRRSSRAVHLAREVSLG